jgi:hypothetical protein
MLSQARETGAVRLSVSQYLGALIQDDPAERALVEEDADFRDEVKRAMDYKRRGTARTASSAL